MKIKFHTELMVDALEKCSKAIIAKPVLPIDRYMLFGVTPAEVTILASNPETDVTVKTSCAADGNIQFCVPGKLLLNTVKLLREPDFTIDTKNIEKKGSLDLKCGSAKYTLHVLPAADFVVNNPESCQYSASFSADILKDVIKTMSKLVGSDKNRAAMMNIYVSEEKGQMKFISASTAFLGKHIFRPHSISSWEKAALFSPTISPLIEKCFSDKGILDVMHNEKRIFIYNEGARVSCLLSTLQYPDVDIFFNNVPKTIIRLNTNEMKGALERLLLYADETTTAVSLQTRHDDLNKMVLWSSDNNNKNEGEEEVVINGNTEPFFFTFQIDYFLKVISSFDNNEFDFVFNPDMPKSHTFIFPMHNDSERSNKEFILMPYSGVKREDI